MPKVKETIWSIIRKVDFLGLVLRFYHKSGVLNDGWYRSFRDDKPVDRKGHPIPWYTYPSIYFLESRLKPRMRVFEFGCGNSTLWFSERVKEVISVDNNSQWVKLISSRAPNNCSLILREDQETYVAEVSKHGHFDIIVIDGRFRDTCYFSSIKFLKNDGVIVWDNSNRDDFLGIYSQIVGEGFKQLPFVGLAPIYWVNSETSVLYRSENCFDL